MNHQSVSTSAAQFVDHLSENAFAIMSLDGARRGDYGHHFTLGLCRFGLPELYMHHPAEDHCGDLLQDFGDRHMVHMLQNGMEVLSGYKHEDGSPILFTVRYLSGPQLYAAAVQFNTVYKQLFDGEEFDAIFTYGICQIFWPDEDNIPVALMDDLLDAVSAQQIEGLPVH